MALIARSATMAMTVPVAWRDAAVSRFLAGMNDIIREGSKGKRKTEYRIRA